MFRPDLFKSRSLDFTDILHVRATRVEIAAGRRIRGIGNITFETASDQISVDFAPVLTSVTKVLAEFDKTLVDVAGHTDNVGAADYNLNLSRRRAGRVGDFLRGRGVHPARIVSEGYGFKYPIASNDSEVGRRQNRRVEISLRPLR